MKLEPDFINDLFTLFNETLNSNAQLSLKRILSTKLPTKQTIIARNQIIQSFIDNNHLFRDYHYALIHHREVFMNLEQANFTQILSFQNPLKTLNGNKKLSQDIKGKTIQFVLFFNLYFTKYVLSFNDNALPTDYKNSFIDFKEYLASFQLDRYAKLVEDKKFNTKEALEIVHLINEQFLAKKQFTFTTFFSDFEAYISISKKAIEHQLTFAEIDSKTLSIQQYYHPQLKNPVKNSFTNPNGVVLLTGANMAGKSTFLKTLGICVYLAHIGLPIPAEKATIPFYDKIYLFINNNDDLQSGYSYFMQEVLNLKEVVLQCVKNENCFALFDELFKGTNFEDAFDILQTTLKGLLKFENSFFVISSHIHQLKDTLVTENKIIPYYLECLIKNNAPEFTYKIKEGFSDLKLGKIIFETEKMNDLLK